MESDLQDCGDNYDCRCDEDSVELECNEKGYDGKEIEHELHGRKRRVTGSLS
jgi:hypothetical protein